MINTDPTTIVRNKTVSEIRRERMDPGNRQLDQKPGTSA